MIDYDKVTPLAQFMIEMIAKYPENREADGVRWDYVHDDVMMDYPGEFDDELFEEAVDLILEAAYKPTLH
jgi:hypothetical protein